MMQITVDPSGLSQAQREAVAGFLLAYPVDSCAAEVHDNTELAALDRDAKLPTPPVDLSAAEAGAAFAVLPAPGADPFTTSAATPAGNVPPPPVAIAPPPVNLGPASSGAPVMSADLDKNGLPWDSRIHAESKAKVADGSWRMKRNLDPAVRATVEAELRQVMGAPAAPLAVPTVTTPAPAAPVGASSPTITALPAVAPPPPPVTIAPVVQPAPVGSMAAFGQAVEADGRQAFVQLVGRASAAMQAGKITQAEITECCQAAGIPALPLLANRLDLVQRVAADVDAIIAARQ